MGNNNAMLLKGSCHCGAVRFSVRSGTPFPYLQCYCSICRKTGGGGGYAINIMGKANTLKVKGKTGLSTYRAKLGKGRRSPGRRNFCKHCGSALWAWDPRWPDWVYPLASAIDTPLPKPRERQHIFLAAKPTWVGVPKGKSERCFRGYPREGIMEWHRKRGLSR